MINLLCNFFIMGVPGAIDNYVISPEQSQEKGAIFTCTGSFRIFAMNILLDGKSIEDVDGEISEKVKKLNGDTKLSVEEILQMLSNDELAKLKNTLEKHPESHLLEIFKIFHDGEKALNVYRENLGVNSSDNELIEYLKGLILDNSDENEICKFHKLITLLHAKNGRYGDAIDSLNKTLRFESEENLWITCIYLGIYFERMGDYELAKNFLITAERINKNNGN